MMGAFESVILPNQLRRHPCSNPLLCDVVSHSLPVRLRAVRLGSSYGTNDVYPIREERIVGDTNTVRDRSREEHAVHVDP